MAQFDQAKAQQLAGQFRQFAPPAPAAPSSPNKGKGKEKAGAREEAVKAAGAKLAKARDAAKSQDDEAIASLRASEGLRDAPPSDAEEHRLAVLRLQLARLRAEAASYKAAVSSVPADSPIINAPQALGELKARRLVNRQIVEQKKAAEVDRQLIEDAEQELAMAKRMRTEAAGLKRGLEERFAEVQAQKEQTPADLVSEAKKRAKALEDSGSLMQGQLVEFIDRLGDTGRPEDDEDEPPSDSEALRGIRRFFRPAKRPRKSDAGPDVKVHQLKSLLERLMNLSVTSPTDPWVNISPPSDDDPDLGGLGTSPELVNWVLRAGIAVEHPADARRLKLVEFWRQIGTERESDELL